MLHSRCHPRISKVFSLVCGLLFRPPPQGPIAWPMSYSLPPLPKSPAQRVNPGWADALYRDVECGMPLGRWHEVDIDDEEWEEMMPSMPSLHDRLKASMGQPSTPPVALWTKNPFGSDAA